MPMKCMAHTPPPSATAPVANASSLYSGLRLMRATPASCSAMPEVKVATTSESTTSQGL